MNNFLKNSQYPIDNYLSIGYCIIRGMKNNRALALNDKSNIYQRFRESVSFYSEL